MLLNTFEFLIFAMRLLGLVPLSALLVTIVLSQRVHRHIVFTNFVCTYVLYDSLMTFFDVMDFSLTASEEFVLGIELVVETLADCTRMIALTSTLNLVVHLWFALRAAFHVETAQAEKLRTFTLLVSPYIVGMIPFIELSYKNITHFNFVLNLTSYFELALVIIISLWDILLLFTYYTHRRIFRQANMQRIMSLSLLIRLFGFCIFRSIFSVIVLIKLILDIKSPNSRAGIILLDVTDMAESFSPILGFCLLGLQRDLLRVWFPCVFSSGRLDSSKSMTTNWTLDTELFSGRSQMTSNGSCEEPSPTTERASDCGGEI